MTVDIYDIVLMAIGLLLWCLVCWVIGFKQGREEGYTAGYMKGRTVGRTQAGVK